MTTTEEIDDTPLGFRGGISQVEVLHDKGAGRPSTRVSCPTRISVLAEEQPSQDLKPDFVRFGFAMYHQYGIPYSFYPSLAVYGAPEQKVPFKQLLPVTLIHNVYPITWCGTVEDLKPVWRIMDDWRTTSEWIPYWKNSDLVRSFHQDVKVSVYLKRPVKQSLLLVANVGKEPQSGTLSLNLPKLGLSERKAKVTRLPESASFADASGDASGEAHLSGSELSATLPGRSIEFYRVEQR